MYTAFTSDIYLYAYSNHFLGMCAWHSGVHGHICMVDLFYIVAGIFIIAIAFGLVLGYHNGTLIWLP